MSNYKFHAMQEFKAAGWCDQDGKFGDEMQEDICNHVLDLLDAFDGEGHSGSSSSYTVDLFSKLALFKPLVPLTGEDWEWNEISDEYSVYNNTTVYQNNRCSDVFKQSDRFDGQPYFLDGKVFWEWYTDPETGEKHKSYYTCADSLVPITFPYTPTTEYVYRESDAE